MTILKWQPTCEQEVVALFCSAIEQLGFESIEKIDKPFPDCIAIDKNGERKRIEFEYLSGNFIIHKHKVTGCDIVICWEKDKDLDSTLKVIDLSEHEIFKDKLEKNPNVVEKDNNIAEKIIRKISENGLSLEEFKRKIKKFHPDYQISEARLLIARMFANDCEPYIKDGKIYFTRKPPDKIIKWAVSKKRDLIEKAESLLKSFGFLT
jgi:hypothetical protein